MTHTRCKLHAILKHYGVTQEAFADTIGCAQCQVSNWGLSQTYPSVGTVLDILAALERVTGRSWDVREVWVPAADRPTLCNSKARANAEFGRVSAIAAKVRGRAFA